MVRQDKLRVHPLLGLAVTLLLGVNLAIPAPASAASSDSINALRQMGKAFASIAEKASPAVVSIQAERPMADDDYTDQLRRAPFGDPFGDGANPFDFFFGPRQYQRRGVPRQQQQPRLEPVRGSGFIISKDGYILTNNHLVGKAEKVTVTLGKDKEMTAKIIGSDPESDVAVIKIEGTDLPWLELADSDALEVGEWVIAIGNPFGLSHTVTAGIVSAKGRNSQQGLGSMAYQDFIQTDAAINPGNSGGPLLNLDGKVVGINAAILGASGGNIGIGFAIPMNLAKNVYEQLIATGQIDRGFLGVRPDDVTNDVAKSMGLEDTKGALITEVTEGSPADKAGLKTYDVVTAVNGQPVESAQDFRNKIAKAKPGSEAKMTVIREGERKTVTATLERRDADKLAGDTKTTDKDTLLGLEVATLTKADAQRYGFDGDTPTGVVITGVEPGSEAARKGIEPGLVILEVNRQPIKNVKEFNAAVQRAKDKGVVMLRVTDGNTRPIVTLSLKDK
jgi:serine protease Do